MSTFRSEITIVVSSARVEVPAQAFYYLEYKVKDTKICRKSSEKFSNNKNLIQFADRKTFPFDQCDYLGSCEGELKVSLYIKKLVREQMQDRAQLIGQINLLFSQIIDGKYAEDRQVPFTVSSSNTFLTFYCSSNSQKRKSNIVLSNQAIERQKDDELISQVSHSPPSLSNDCHSPPSQHKSQTPPAKQNFYVHQGSFFSQQSLLKAIESPSFLQKRIQQMQNMDMEFLIKDIYRLQRLLYIGRNQRKMEIDRHDQEIKDFARQLSLKQAQLIKNRDEMVRISEKTGELLDQCEYLTRQKQNFESSLKNQQLLNRKLQQSYQQLSHRIQQLCIEGKDSNLMKQQFTQEKMKRNQLQKQLAIQVQKQMQLMQQLQDTKKQLISLENKHEQLLFELHSKQQMVNLCKEYYEQRLGQLQEKIDMIEEQGQYVHRQTYEDYSCPKSIIDKIRIEQQMDQNAALRRIIEQQLQESIASIEDKNKNIEENHKIIPQICTATTIPDHNARHQLQFLQILTKNLQKDYDRLQCLYQEMDERLNYKNFQLEQSEKSLAQLRYQFILQLSKVTALINQHMIENRSLRQQNLQLKQSLNAERYKHQIVVSSEQQFPDKVKHSSQTTPFSQAFRREQSFYHDKCKKLQQQNELLLRYNRQKQELYDMIMGSRYEEGDKIAERFEDSFNYILQNKSKFSQLLQKYGLLHCSLDDCSKKVINSQETISEIINNFAKDQQEIFKKRITQSSVIYQSCQLIHSKHNQDLLLQSTAKQHSVMVETLKISDIEGAITQISTLVRERQKFVGSFLCKQQANIDSINKQTLCKKIQKKMQQFKVMLMRQLKNTPKNHIISVLKEIQHLISEYCLL